MVQFFVLFFRLSPSPENFSANALARLYTQNSEEIIFLCFD